MTFHTTRITTRRASGHKYETKTHYAEKALRFSTSFPASDLRRAAWLARKKGQPVAVIMREALHDFLASRQSWLKDPGDTNLVKENDNAAV